jgi:hypothetical protein
MGSGCSSQGGKVATELETGKPPKDTPPPPQWKIFPSIAEAKGFYKADGTFDKWVDPGHLELRTLLDEPQGQHSLGGEYILFIMFLTMCYWNWNEI